MPHVKKHTRKVNASNLVRRMFSQGAEVSTRLYNDMTKKTHNEHVFDDAAKAAMYANTQPESIMFTMVDAPGTKVKYVHGYTNVDSLGQYTVLTPKRSTKKISLTLDVAPRHSSSEKVLEREQALLP